MVAALGALAALWMGPLAQTASALPPIKHVFIVVLENKDFDDTFAPDSPAPYLAKTLPKKGQLLTKYYAIGHLSNDNYLAMISGQSPNPQTQADCQNFTEFVFVNPAKPISTFSGTGGQAWGQGCVYPAFITTIADQLQTKGLLWKGYMEDMGNDKARDNGRRCAHPDIGASDGTQHAEVGDQYATRHNPFVYFHSIIDGPYCDDRVVPLSQLPNDLDNAGNTPSYSFIVPNLCNDGHDEPCVDGEPGGLVSINTWLKKWIPKVLASPAFKKDGLLIVTFDEAEFPSDSSACCNQPVGPNTPSAGITGPGGGKIGAVLVSPFIKPGSVNNTPYNHYALLRSIEDLFGFPGLGYAGLNSVVAFGKDVYGG
jgi:hypothetical protein